MRTQRKFLVNFENNSKNKGVRNNPFHFFFFDTETKQETVEKRIGKKTYKTIINKLDMGWCCYWNRESNRRYWNYFETIEEFNHFLTQAINISGDKSLWIIAHNIVFDSFITDIWEYLKTKKYETQFIHSKGMVFIQKLRKTKVYVNKKGEEKIQTVKNILLVNNGNIFPEKLENIGETIGYPKLKVDFKTSSREEINTYCKRDVEILVEFWKQWIEFIDTNKLGNIKFTISSQSMEAFKRRFCKEYVVLDNDIENLEFERQSYYGGRTEIFYKGTVKSKVYYYDVNSMYPHVMRNFRYPTEHKFTKNNPSIEQILYYIEKGYLINAECYLDTKNNYYPVKMNNTLMFPIGKFKTYLATPEIIEAINNNDLVKFGKVGIYKSANIFEEYIDFFYNKRLELKREGNKQEKMYKLFLNSLYGKFGQKMDKWIKTTIEEIRAFDLDFDFDNWIMDLYKIPKILIGGLDVTPKIRYIAGELQLSGEETESDMSFPIIASHVTSYARMIILTAIKYCKEHNIKYYYCDTDSIFTDKELPEEIVNENELGKYKIEKIFDHGVEFINLKNYCGLSPDGHKIVTNDNNDKIILENESLLKESKILKGEYWKMKGVSNKAIMIDENNFIVQEWGGLPKQEYYRKFGRKPGEFWIIEKHKTNHGKINKGSLLNNGNINPFELEDF